GAGGRGERHRAGGVPVHHQSAGVVGVVRGRGSGGGGGRGDVAGRGVAGRETGASGVYGALGGGAMMVDCTRREFFGLVGGLASAALYRPLPPSAAQDSLPGTGPSGRLFDPARAGRPLPPVTARDNDAAIQVIEKQLKCTCGCNQDVYTCRTTDFSCTTSPAMHQRVLQLAARAPAAFGATAAEPERLRRELDRLPG